MTISEEKIQKNTTLKNVLTDKASMLALSASTSVFAVGMAANLSNILGRSKAREFSFKVSDIISGDDFISDLSDRIGTPMASETEDEFVARAKSLMKNLLSEKLK